MKIVEYSVPSKKDWIINSLRIVFIPRIDAIIWAPAWGLGMPSLSWLMLFWKCNINLKFLFFFRLRITLASMPVTCQKCPTSRFCCTVQVQRPCSMQLHWSRQIWDLAIGNFYTRSLVAGNSVCAVHLVHLNWTDVDFISRMAVMSRTALDAYGLSTSKQLESVLSATKTSRDIQFTL